MKTQFDISQFIKGGRIQNELDMERALIADRKLRVLSKEDESLIPIRKKLRDLIEQYENEHWSSNSKVSDEKIQESDLAEIIAEKERLFIQHRKELIRKKLKDLKLTQQDFGKILGHKSKTYISELINGVSPFSIRDLIVINRLLKIELNELIPTFLPHYERVRIKSNIKKLDNPRIRLRKEDFELV